MKPTPDTQFKYPSEANSDVKRGEIYTVEEIANLGFTPTGHGFAFGQIYKRNGDMCVLETTDDGELRVHLGTFQ